MTIKPVLQLSETMKRCFATHGAKKRNRKAQIFLID